MLFYILLLLLSTAAAIHGLLNIQAGRAASLHLGMHSLGSLSSKGTGKGSPRLNQGRLSLLYISAVLLMNANDVNLNPGPNNNNSTFYPCGACKNAVNWNDQALMCDNCETWLHLNCQDVNEDSYDRLGSSNVVWFCMACDGSNYSSILFNLHGIESEKQVQRPQ